MAQPKQAIRTGKQNRHEKITVCMLSGNPVTIDEIKAIFLGTDQETQLYRIPQNISAIKHDGGIVKSIKTGRNVVAYQLMNPEKFDKTGRYIQAPVQPSVQPSVVSEVEVPELLAA
jgi:hypothetical protein